MSKKQDKMYEFITSPENFEAACDLVDEFPNVKQRLRKEFWLKVRDALKEELLRFEGWRIWDNINDAYNPAIAIYRDEFCFEKPGEAKVAIRIEHLNDVPWYGLFVNRQWINFDFNDIWTQATELKLPEFKIGEIKGWWWPLYNKLPYDFNSSKDIQKLIPPERDGLQKEIVSAMMNAMDKLAAFTESYFIPK